MANNDGGIIRKHCPFCWRIITFSSLSTRHVRRCRCGERVSRESAHERFKQKTSGFHSILTDFYWISFGLMSQRAFLATAVFGGIIILAIVAIVNRAPYPNLADNPPSPQSIPLPPASSNYASAVVPSMNNEERLNQDIAKRMKEGYTIDEYAKFEQNDEKLSEFQRKWHISDGIAEAAVKKWCKEHGSTKWELEEVKVNCMQMKLEGIPREFLSD